MLSPEFLDLLVLAQDAASDAAAKTGDGQGSGGSAGSLFMPLIAIFLIFYVLIIRPEGKKRKEREKKINTLQKGAQVVTTGGIMGTVRKVGDKVVVVEVDKKSNTRLTFVKTAIFEVLSDEALAAAAAAEKAKEEEPAGHDSGEDR